MTSVPTAPPTADPRRRPPGPPPSQPTGSTLPAAMIDPIKLAKKYAIWLAIAAVVGLVFGVALRAALVKVAPRYTPEVTFQARPAERDPSVPLAAGRVDENEMQRFIETQVAVMRSRQIAEAVARDPRLTQEASTWASQYMERGVFNEVAAAESLQRMINARSVPRTYLIRMSMTWSQAHDATAILRLAKENYIRWAQEQANLDNRDRIDLLQRRITGIDDDIVQLRTRRDRLIQDEELDTIDQARTEQAQRLNLITRELIQVQQTITALQDSLTLYEGMLASETGITYNDSQRARVDQQRLVAGFRQQIKDLEAELLSLSQQGYRPGHRTVRAVRARIDALEQKLADAREEELRKLFDAEVDGTRRSLSQLRAQEAELLSKSETLRLELTDLTRILGEIQEIDRRIDRLLAGRETDRQKLGNLQTTASLRFAGRVQVAEPERVPRGVSFPPNAIIMGILGMIALTGLTAGVAVLREVLDQRVKSGSDVTLIPRTRVIGVVPMSSEDPSAPKSIETAFVDHPTGVLAESYRQLRTTVQKTMQRAGHKSLLVMSGMPGSGSTTAVSNLALACIATDTRVLVIDANFRRPGLHRVFGTGEVPGLADVLAGTKTLAEAAIKTESGVHVLPAGSRENRVFERLGTSSMTELLREAGESYDLVLVDVAPAIVAGDGLAVANRCDASMLVVRALGEKRGMVARIKNELSESHAEFLGVLVNAVRPSAGGYMKRNIRATQEYQNGLVGDNGRPQA